MKHLRGALTAAAILVLTALVVLLSLLVLPGALGDASYALTDGGMEPAMPKGSAVYVRADLPEILSPGDVIVFHPADAPEEIRVRRVTENRPGERLLLVTEESGGADSAVFYDRYLGRVRLCMPHLGAVSAFLGTLPGRISAMALLTAAGLLFVLSGALPAPESGKKPDRRRLLRGAAWVVTLGIMALSIFQIVTYFR